MADPIADFYQDALDQGAPKDEIRAVITKLIECLQDMMDRGATKQKLPAVFTTMTALKRLNASLV